MSETKIRNGKASVLVTVLLTGIFCFYGIITISFIIRFTELSSIESFFNFIVLLGIVIASALIKLIPEIIECMIPRFGTDCIGMFNISYIADILNFEIIQGFEIFFLNLLKF